MESIKLARISVVACVVTLFVIGFGEASAVFSLKKPKASKQAIAPLALMDESPVETSLVSYGGQAPVADLFAGDPNAAIEGMGLGAQSSLQVALEQIKGALQQLQTTIAELSDEVSRDNEANDASITQADEALGHANEDLQRADSRLAVSDALLSKR